MRARSCKGGFSNVRVETMIRIKAIPLADVIAGSGTRYNTNNCWQAEGRPKPANYAATQEACNTRHWIYINPFGADYSAGSSLFGWQQDHETLTSRDGNVEFRYPVVV